VFSRSVLPIVGLLLAAILIIAHIYWLVERKTDPSFPKAYLPGVWEALWWACVTIVTVGYGDRVPRGIAGRLVAMFWMFAGLFLISNFTATVTSELTLRELRGVINSVDDLPGKRVLGVANTTSTRVLTARAIAHTDTATVEDGLALLTAGQADALVFDAPVLLYYIAHEGRGQVQLAGGVFNPEAYGIAFPTGSSLREAVNVALLNIREDGTYTALYEKYFGNR
jgi:polar amino acid transport system substrate-binding protein